MQLFLLELFLLQQIFHLCCSSMLDIPLGARCEGNWICSRIQNCSSIYPLAVSRPNVCSFINNNEPVYCCPPPHRENFDYKIFSSCQEKSNPDCIIIRKKRQLDQWPYRGIIDYSPAMGGYEADPRSHTYMALVGYGKLLDDVEWSCAGSIISTSFILSAAHCAFDNNKKEASWVRVGDLDVSTDEDDASPINVRISQRIIHPKYKEGFAYNDIALFKLERSLYYSKWVGQICLYTKTHIEASEATISGWGQTGFVNKRSSHLMVVDLPIIPGEECKSLLGSLNMLPTGVDTEAMICAGDRKGEKDACQGDSGGPLALNSTTGCFKDQIGIISFGRMCGLPNSPGVYTRIYPYLSWIQTIVWPASD